MNYDEWFKSLNQNGRETYFLGQDGTISKEAWNYQQAKIDELQARVVELTKAMSEVQMMSHKSISYEHDLFDKGWNQASKQVVIIIGGAYGVNETVQKRADFVWSLSNLVFPHQLVRLILTEQLYRSQEIANGNPYHHE